MMMKNLFLNTSSSSSRQKKKNTNNPLLLLASFLLFFGGSTTTVSAESRIEINVDSVLDPTSTTGGGGIVSEPFVGNLHGSGYLNFAELSIVETTTTTNSETTTTASSSSSSVSLDAAIFILKKQQRNDPSIWLGDAIGRMASDGSTHYCCTKTSQQLLYLGENNQSDNLCREDQIGQLIINDRQDDNIVRVEHRPIKSSNNNNIGMEGVVSVDETEHLILVFGYCDNSIDDDNTNNDGKVVAVRILGKVIWVSYESGNTIPLYASFVILTAGLAIWYQRLMAQHTESRIQVEEWILVTLWLATAAVGLQTVLIVTEVYGENELLLLEFFSDTLTSIAAAASRCLYLVLAMGLGVITSKLSKTTNGMLGVCLGGYVLGLIAIDAMDLIDRGSVIAMFEWIILGLDVTFLIWIPCALRSTMKYLNRNGEELKLVRYRWILRIYVLSIVLSVVQFGLFFADMVHSGGRNYDLESMRDGNQVNYLVVLGCIAYLWRPNPFQQKFSYVLLEDDLSCGDGKEEGDDDDETTKISNDLELTEIVKEDNDGEGAIV